MAGSVTLATLSFVRKGRQHGVCGCASTIGTLRKAAVPAFASECCLTLGTALSLSTSLLPQSHNSSCSSFRIGLLQHWTPLPDLHCHRRLHGPIGVRVPRTHVHRASPHFSVAGADRSPSHGNRFLFHFSLTVGFSSSRSRHLQRPAVSRGCFSSCRCSIPTCSCSRSPSRHAPPPHQLWSSPCTSVAFTVTHTSHRSRRPDVLQNSSAPVFHRLL